MVTKEKLEELLEEWRKDIDEGLDDGWERSED